MTRAHAVLVGVVLVLTSSVRAQLPQATFESGHYHHGSGITFDVPGTWRYDWTRPGVLPVDETAHFTTPSGWEFSAWLSARKTNEQLVGVTLDRVIEEKTMQRAREGYQHWQVRADSVTRTTINGHDAVTATADWEMRISHAPRVERLTWIFTANSRVQFFSVTSPEQLSAMTSEFDRVAASAVLP